ncbi:MAG: trypsin-like peptidase domain-containing protein [Saprospiraceae bacterium]|nr:trypsin-like peptidase domain-containing protein [Saprospiraceae bacterium]MBP7680204.1 trypsin-like peptidase domain-containing protein [Saprospiraceae bacterium]
MKNILSLIFAAILGGLVALGGAKYMTKQTSASGNEGVARFANNVLNSTPAAPIADFSDAATKASASVVNIKASESKGAAQKRQQDEFRNSPFGQMFGPDFFYGGSPFQMPNQQKEGTGSGVIVSNDGYIVTNNHVVDFADEVEVTLYDNRTFKAKVIGTDPKTDLAVIKIDADNLPAAERGDSDKLRVGQWALAVGNPLELNATVTAGIISALGRDINILGGGDAIESFIQTDAAVNPGNSGGALVDAQGRLIGINAAIKTPTGYYTGYSFAIPVNLMSKVVDDLIKYGKNMRGYLGVNITDMNSEIAKELNVNISQGIFVDDVVQGGSAQYAGVIPNDIITEVDGKHVKSVADLQVAVGSKKVGDVVTLTILRDGVAKQVPVKLKAMDDLQKRRTSRN